MHMPKKTMPKGKGMHMEEEEMEYGMKGKGNGGKMKGNRKGTNPPGGVKPAVCNRM